MVMVAVYAFDAWASARVLPTRASRKKLLRAVGFAMVTLIMLMVMGTTIVDVVIILLWIILVGIMIMCSMSVSHRRCSFRDLKSWSLKSLNPRLAHGFTQNAVAQ